MSQRHVSPRSAGSRGRPDPFYTFAQMLLIVLFAVFVGDAAGDEGRGFALVYTAYLSLLTWLWPSLTDRCRPGS